MLDVTGPRIEKVMKEVYSSKQDDFEALTRTMVDGAVPSCLICFISQAPAIRETLKSSAVNCVPNSRFSLSNDFGENLRRSDLMRILSQTDEENSEFSSKMWDQDRVYARVLADDLFLCTTGGNQLDNFLHYYNTIVF